MAGRVIKQGTFTCMLLLSAVLVYAVSIAGVHAGRLKLDISWAHPLFVALFNREYIVTADEDSADTVTDADVEGTEAMDKNAAENFTLDRTEDEAVGEGSAGNTAGIEEIMYADDSGYSTTDDEAADDNVISDDIYETAEAAESKVRVSGQVEYAKRDMRYARSGYYNDSDIIALSSQLEYVQVDNGYFSDACFIGDSRIEGLYFYGGLKEADYFYKPGTTVYDMMDAKLSCNGSASSYIDVPSALSKKQYRKIYIMAGVNELGDKTPEAYAQAYADNIERIRRLQPEASIFIMGMMHVTTEYSDASDVFNNDNIDNRNTAAAGIADGERVFYLDMNECVDDERGGVREEYSKDGVHLKAEYYKLWTEWMKAHGVNDLTK